MLENNQTVCERFGYKCNMVPVLKEETVPVYAHKRIQSRGDNSMDSFEIIPYGNPIGYEKKYTAFYQCSFCKRIESLGSIQVPIVDTITFDDFILEQEMSGELNAALMEYDRKQEQEREDFIRQFRKDYKIRKRK